MEKRLTELGGSHTEVEMYMDELIWDRRIDEYIGYMV